MTEIKNSPARPLGHTADTRRIAHVDIAVHITGVGRYMVIRMEEDLFVSGHLLRNESISGNKGRRNAAPVGRFSLCLHFLQVGGMVRNTCAAIVFVSRSIRSQKISTGE